MPKEHSSPVKGERNAAPGMTPQKERYKRDNKLVKKSRKEFIVSKVPKELKSYDKVRVDYVPNSYITGVFHQPITAMTQGTADNQRIGNSITIKSFQIVGSWFVDCNTISFKTIGAIHLRWFLLLDTQANGLIPNLNEVFDNTANFNEAAMPNVANSDRFRILRDERMAIMPNAWNADTNLWNYPIGRIDYFRKMNIKIDFNGPFGDQSQIVSNNLLFCAVQNQGQYSMQMNFMTRIRYSDC
jgi:hypothetical protein